MAEDSVFTMNQISETKVVLHNGVIVPLLGYRVDTDNKDNIYQSVLNAVAAGFRHFDLPADGESEKLFRKAMDDCGVPRYELFLTLKLGNDDHGYEKGMRALNNSLRRLGTDYADLYLVNWPNPLRFRKDYEKNSADTWRAMESLYKSGMVRAIGLANSTSLHIEHYLEIAEISPMVNQIRMYPGFPSYDNFSCAIAHGIQTEGFLPPVHDEILNSRELQIFAEKYNATPRQICMKYLLQKKCIALCQGNDTDELRQLENVFSFTLSENDMKYLDVMKNYGMEYIDPDTCEF